MIMTFKTQTCTTQAQSRRLLALGLRPETADMVHRNRYVKGRNETYVDVIKECTPPLSQDTPAWSLHRLIEISGCRLCIDGLYLIVQGHFLYDKKDNLFDNLIDAITDIVDCGLLDKKYIN